MAICSPGECGACERRVKTTGLCGRKEWIAVIRNGHQAGKINQRPTGDDLEMNIGQ
jgi:hypothetical protein